MDTESGMRPLLMVPEMLLFGGGLAVMISGSFLPRRRQWWTGVVAATVLIAAVVAAVVEAAGPNLAAFEGTFAVDATTGVARILAAAGALFTLAVAVGEVRGSPRESET
ncbi:NADH-quinone oxidoreductase subunit N, partial [Mycobacterium nebraskense]|nr:NADH-quinone oxidoreductase subunit N [Mycobacterium nebraskense]